MYFFTSYICKRYKFIGIMLFLLMVILLFYCNINFIHKSLNSDDSSELILGSLLAKENAFFLSNNWCYSSEIRILNTQIVNGLLFRFFNDWLTIRILGNGIAYIILLICIYLFCKVIDIIEEFPYIACIIISPFSLVYYRYVLSVPYYIPHIVIIILGLWFMIKFHEHSKLKYLIYASLLSLVAGIGGSRHLLIFYGPLVFASLFIWHKNSNSFEIKKIIRFNMTILLFNFIGVIFNGIVLRKIYSFASFQSVRYIDFSLTRLGNFIASLFSNLGFINQKNIFSYISFVNFSAIIVIIILYFFLTKNEDKLILNVLKKYLMFAFLGILGLYVITDMPMRDRYITPIIVIAIIVLISSFKRFVNQYKLAVFLLAVVMNINALINYRLISKVDINLENRKIVNALTTNGYYNGYATFWQGNILTELSNGKIDVWNISPYENKITFDSINRWLQKKEHFTRRPSGKVFVYLKKEELNKLVFKNTIKDENILYESKDRIVYGFEDYNILKFYILTN